MVYTNTHTHTPYADRVYDPDAEDPPGPDDEKDDPEQPAEVFVEEDEQENSDSDVDAAVEYDDVVDQVYDGLEKVEKRSRERER